MTAGGPWLKHEEKALRKHSVRMILAAAAVVLQVAGTASVVAAEAVPEVVFDITPRTGFPGAPITFSGTGCPHDSAKTFDGLIFLAQGSTNTATQDFTSNADGSFSRTYDTANLAPGQYTPFVFCSNTSKGGPGPTYTVVAAPVTGATYKPLSPARILDTRNGTGAGGATTPVGEGATINLKVAGVGGVPATGVAAIALNVTATGANGPGSYLTVFPTGSTRPLASNLNFNPGLSIPNMVIARVGPDGHVSIYNNLGSVHVVADVQGYYSTSQTAESSYVPVNPLRILDTRTGTGVAQAKVPAGGSIDLKVTELGGVPATGATAVVLNMTTTEATGPESFLTVWPAGQTRPTVSNLNFTSGPASTNAVVVQVGDGGKISIYNNLGSTDVVADLNGWFSASGGTAGQVYYPINPVRVLDSRNGTGTPGGAVGQLGTGGVIDVTLSGVGGVPSAVTAAVLNVTAADSPGPESYLTLYPSGTTRPLASSLNFIAQQTVPNLVMVRMGGGKVSIYNNLGSAAVIADIQGWYAAPA